MSVGYSTREVAKLVNLPERRIRALARAGLVGPALDDRGRQPLRFDFRDLQVLRAASKLVSEGLPPLRIQRALTALKRQLAGERPLSGTQLHHESGKLLASDGDGHWDPESGQCVLRFGANRRPELAPISLVPLPSVVAPAPEGQVPDDMESADAWFDLALEHEDNAPQRAYECYLKALACDPEHVEATINIGRLCSASGDTRRAAAYFRLASRIDPAHPVAHFNLAVTLHDMGDLAGAVGAYRIALLHDPHFADAHYNLATLLEQQGEREEAFKHFKAYRSVLDRSPGS